MNREQLTIDLNCDVGELPHLLSDGTEEALMQQISSANIACGGHAGSVESMQSLVKLAMKYGIAIGAHISYPDRENFGRKEMTLAAEEIEEAAHSQISLLSKFAGELGARVQHVKPHGALYHAAQKNEAIATAIANAARRVDEKLVLVEQASSRVLSFWSERRHSVIGEAFADRVYESDGKLRSRELPAALITDPALAAEQAVRVARDHTVVARDGSRLHLDAQTICVHGDTPGAVETARAIRMALRKVEIDVAAVNPQH